MHQLKCETHQDTQDRVPAETQHVFTAPPHFSLHSFIIVQGLKCYGWGVFWIWCVINKAGPQSQMTSRAPFNLSN